VSKRKWYIAVLVVASRVEDGRVAGSLVDLQYKLIRATDHEAAYLRALELGTSEVLSYESVAGANVHWEFVGLHDLREIEAPRLRDGIELYSRMLRADSQELARPKHELTAYWIEANRHKTAAEILES
jgi:hypothetical protein